MDRLFLDANVLFSAAYRADAGIARLWKLDGVVLCSSPYALEEASVNLANRTQQRRLKRLSRHVRLFEARATNLPSDISLPEKDWPILLAAIQANATHLITGDVRHFGRYFGRKIAGILIILPGDHLRTASER